MSFLSDSAISFLSILTILVHIAFVLYAISFILRLVRIKPGAFPLLEPLFSFFFKVQTGLKSRSLSLACLIAITAMAGSLFFSEVVGWEPCKLCWFQRIFMYPQAVILLLALIFKERRIWPYTLALSIIGGMISAYHYATSTLSSASSTGVCTVGGGPSCLVNYFTQYGYVTLPLMALTASVSIALISWYWLREKEK